MFREKVLKFIRSVPKGKVVSYGQVAAACGIARAARQVGFILRSLDITQSNVPWWRVINNKGEISIKGNWTASKQEQLRLLKVEGVTVSKDFKVEMEIFRWKNSFTQKMFKKIVDSK